jgi:membrane dipeptidase
VTRLADRIARLHREAPLTDAHAHPSLGAYLAGRNLWRRYWAGKRYNPFFSRADFETLTRGGVGLVWSALYLPERRLARDCRVISGLLRLLPWVYRKLTTGSPFARLLEMMDALEGEVDRRPERAAVARSVAELERIRCAGRLAVVHTVEGGHLLDGDPGNLDVLARRGVAAVTLTHFFDNRLARAANSIPDGFLVRRICCFRDGAGVGDGPPLTGLGREVIRRMLDLGMIVDVSHCAPDARREVYREVRGRRPVIASHVGVAALQPDPYNLADDELRTIAATGGAVGVIFMPYWLTRRPSRDGLGAIWETMRHIRSVTGSWDHVMLGTDFDGFSAPPRDLRDATKLGRVTRMLLEQALAEEDVKKVLGGNAMRVLREGWR